MTGGDGGGGQGKNHKFPNPIFELLHMGKGIKRTSKISNGNILVKSRKNFQKNQKSSKFKISQVREGGEGGEQFPSYTL